MLSSSLIPFNSPRYGRTSLNSPAQYSLRRGHTLPLPLLNRGSLDPPFRGPHIDRYQQRFSDVSQRRFPNGIELYRPDYFADFLPSTLPPSRRYPHSHTYAPFDDRYSRHCDCDHYRKSLSYYPPCHHHNYSHCSCSNSNCNNTSSSSSSSKDFDFKTKDVTVRGKARAVRASYLAEASKFEADLVKYLDKKNEDQVPDRVIGMLIEFINRETYSNNSCLDEVTLNILAHNVGAKSAVEYSLNRLKKFDNDVRSQELTSIVATIMMSSKVDNGLKNWLKKYLQNEERYYRLWRSDPWNILILSRPEVATETARLLDHIPAAEDEGFRML